MDEIKAKKVRTINIEKAIQKYAQENLIPESSCDFTISNIEYQIKDVQNVDFVAIESSTLKEYTDKDKIINEHIQFKQIFTVIIKKTSKHKIKLNYSIEYGHYSSHPKITINTDSGPVIKMQ